MKKILLFLCAVMASFAASAATGNYFISGNFNGWNHANLQFEQDGTKYSIALDGTGLQAFSGEFLICGGTKGTPDWGDKIGGVRNMEIDKEYTYVVGGGNFSVKGVIAYPLTVTFDTATKKIEIAGAEAENEYDTVYLIGDFGDAWSETRTDAALTLKAGTDNVWEGDVTFTGATNYFKMKAGSFVYGTGGDDIKVVLGTEYTAAQSGNAFSLAKGSYHFEFILDKNADTGVLTVTNVGGGGEDPIDPPVTDYSSWYVNILGNFNSWGDNGVNPDAEGITSHTLAIGTSEFKVKIWNGKEIWLSTGTALPVNEWVTIEGNSDVNMTIAGAEEGGLYTVEFNCNNYAIRVSPAGDTPEMDFYLAGSDNGWVAAAEGYKFTKGEDGAYTLHLAKLEGEFKITDGSWSTNWGAEGASDTEPVALELGIEKNAWKGAGNFKVVEPLENAVVTFTYNVSDPCFVMVNGTVTGIEAVAVEAQAAEAVYYNLQGVRVAQPVKGGLYIVNRAGKVAKEIVR